MILAKKSLLITALFLVIFVGVQLNNSPKAMAITGEASNTLPNNPDGAARPWLLVTRPGTNGMNGPKSEAYIYWPKSAGNAKLTIIDACGTTNDEYPSRNTTAYQFYYASSANITNGTGTYINPYGVVPQVTCTGGSDLTVTIVPATGLTGGLAIYNTTLVTVNETEYYRVLFSAYISSKTDSYYVNRFKLRIDTTGGLLGYVANQNPSAPDGYTGIGYSNSGSGWGWQTSIAFASKCNTSTVSFPIKFYDTDYIDAATSSSPYWQDRNHRMNYSVYRYDRKTRIKDTTPVITGDLRGDNNLEDKTNPFSIDSNYVYQLVISNINYVNSIQLALPFDQIYANDDCNTSPEGTINASCDASGTVTLSSVAVKDKEGGFMKITATNATGTATALNIEGQGNVTAPTGNINYSAPNTFRSVQDGMQKTVSGKLVDGVLSVNITGTYTCPKPTTATCELSMSPESIAWNESSTPTYKITNNSTNSSATVSLDLSITTPGKTWNANVASQTLAPSASTSGSLTPIIFTSLEERNWVIAGTLKNSSGATVHSCDTTVRVVRKPYFRVRSTLNTNLVSKGDLSVGGSYDSVDCAPEGPGNLYGWANESIINSVNTLTGSNASFAAKVFGEVKNVYSGSTFTPVSVNKRLTMSNDTGDWGGGLGAGTCLKDMYSTLSDNTPVLSGGGDLVNILTYAARKNEPNKLGKVRFNGNLTITNTASAIVSAGTYIALYVEGDVYISNNITMATTYGSSALDVPVFSLIVKGDIYIDPTVTQLDGIYISQPSDDGGGTIYTCAKGSFSYYSSNDVRAVGNNFFSACRLSLVFNGVVQAKEVKLHRVNGTPASSTVFAESFNLLPELYITKNLFSNSNTTPAKYDSASLLPPLL